MSESSAWGWSWWGRLARPRSEPERWRFAAFLVLTLALVFLAVREVYGPHRYTVWRAERSERNQLERRVQQIQQEDQRLEQWNERLRQGDPSAIEGIARGEGMARPGERIYTLPGRSTTPEDAGGENPPPR